MKKTSFILLSILFFALLLTGCSMREPEDESSKDVVIRFVTDGTSVRSVTNSAVEVAPATQKEGYVMEGWYSDKEFKNRVIFPFSAVKSCSLYVKWIDERKGNDELIYADNQDGTLTVTSCDTVCPTIWIPDTHDGKKVTVLKEGFLRKIIYITSLHIGKNVSSIEENFSHCTALTAFDVDENNADFVSANGVLYSSGKKSLLIYPMAKPDPAFSFPQETESVGNSAFTFNLYLKNLTLDARLIAEYTAFRKMENLERVDVAEGNTCFVSKEGVLYSANGTELLLLPAKYPQKTFSIAQGTLSVKEDGFSGSNVETVVFNNELRYFPAPENVPGLKSYVVSEANAYYGSKDGVLFIDEGKILYLVPQAKEGEYTVPNETKEIYDYAFSGCTLTKITISSTVKKIGRYAFSESKKLETIVFEENSEIESIEETAFARCGLLSGITLTSRIPPETGSALFDACSPTLTVIIPTYTDGLYRQLWSFCTSKLDAKGSPVILYDVVFDACGGSEVAGVRGAYVLTEPFTSKKTEDNADYYYIFLGWFDNPVGTGERIAFPYAVTADITLYAVWDVGYYERRAEE